MSTLQIVYGLAGIAMGLRTVSNGLKSREADRKARLGRLPPVGFQGRSVQKPSRQPLSDVFFNTPSGRIRLRTYNIRNLDERIAHLRKLAKAGKKDPQVYEFVRRVVNGKCGNTWCIPEKDNVAEARALFNAIRKNVRYTSDIAGIDSYQKPRHTLAMRGGDCDDYSTLACAAAGAIGIPCRFKVIRTQGAPTWNHIYAQLGFPRRMPRKWISFDASVPMPFGWEPPPRMVAASRVFPT
ncbi:MAG: transglutaminase domain-containing protein [Anaerolineae bacterium]